MPAGIHSLFYRYFVAKLFSEETEERGGVQGNFLHMLLFLNLFLFLG
jgi:ABC-type Mn2+/Zn2+ transport system permease subunit